MRSLLWGALVALAIVVAPAAAQAAGAGTAKGVDPQADALRGSVTQTLVVGADVFIGDLVKTGEKGLVQILFADTTRLVVGPNSSLKIEDYLVRNNGSAGKFAVDMLGGTFRFATGNAAKSLYQITTPTATIGVRGSEGDFYVSDKITLILVSGGGFQICATGTKDCKIVESTCQLGSVDTKSAILGKTDDISGEDREKLRNEFPFINDQSELNRIFWFMQSIPCLHKPPNTTVPADAGTTGFATDEEEYID